MPDTSNSDSYNVSSNRPNLLNQGMSMGNQENSNNQRETKELLLEQNRLLATIGMDMQTLLDIIRRSFNA